MKNILFTLYLICFLVACNYETESKKGAEIATENDIVEVPVEKSNSSDVKKKSVAELRAELVSKGYEVFDYIDEKTKDTTLMQQYFIAFLKSGPIRNQNEEEANRLQSEHLAYLSKMYALGYADISGTFGDDGEIRGITIYNVPTLKIADSLANADPMVKAGRLVIEVHPWWAAKGFPLR